ncbi:MAG: extracellular solute-binding protein [Butyrivibrio sp.]|nr:extracellular solute-binding protein [Butyrivibrio sp.]
MKVRIRLISVALMACLVGSCLYYAFSGQSSLGKDSIFDSSKTTVRIWYTDSALSDYINSKAVAYNESSKKVRIEPTLVSGLEYLETINQASIEENAYPDIFVVTNDSLEKAYLAGLASEIDNGNILINDEDYPTAAINAVTYDGKVIAYPFYFETSTLLYNKTYLEDEARARIQAELDAAAGEQAQAEADAQEASDDSAEGSLDASTEGSSTEEEDTITQAQIEAQLREMLPNKLSDILSFADSYNAPEAVEAVFKWDVNDIFYNYFFVGGYINIGGAAGDDSSQIDIYNSDAIRCMNIYQQLNQFFAIDSENITYDSVMDDFINGKIVFTVATTDAIARIEAAQEAGETPYEFGAYKMPSLTDEYNSRTMSVTDCLVINGYSEHQTEANMFAKYLCNDYTDELYSKSGKVAARNNVVHENESLNTFLEVYDSSVPLPKMMVMSDYWVLMEIAFTKIWEGEDANATLQAVSEQIMKQVHGEQYTEEALPDPEAVSITPDSENAD